MKICLLSYRGEPYCGGQGVYIHYLSRELCALGHEVHILSGTPHPNVVDTVKLEKLESLDAYSWTGRLPPEPLRLISPLNMYEFGATLFGFFPELFTFSIRAFNRIRGLEKRGTKFDVVHDNQCLGWGLLGIKGMGLPVVATIHHPITVDRDIEIAQARGWWNKFKMMRWYTFLNMQKKVARRLDRILVVSNSSATDTSKAFGLSPQKIRTVYNGVDSEMFTPDNSVTKEPRSLITVGATGHIKGFPYLLKALARLRNDVDVNLTIVGKAPVDGNYPMSLIKEYGLQDRVKYTGRLTPGELVKRYAASEVAVVPSLYEGFGFPAAEAMACKVPLVSTSGGALPEVTGQDGEAGIIVRPADPDAMAGAIKRLLDDEMLRRKLGEAGRLRVESNFTWRQAAQKTVEVYQELL